MQIFKNGRKPPFMDSEFLDLTTEKICFAVNNLNLFGLQAMATYGMLILSLFKSPAEICWDIESLEAKEMNDFDIKQGVRGTVHFQLPGDYVGSGKASLSGDRYDPVIAKLMALVSDYLRTDISDTKVIYLQAKFKQILKEFYHKHCKSATQKEEDTNA